MQKFESIEKIPTWSLPYIINADPTGLTDEEIQLVDDFVSQWKVQVVSPIEVDGEPQPEFSYYPLFGKATEVEPCIVIYSKEQ